MWVQGKDIAETLRLHEFQAHTVHKTQPPPILPQQPLSSLPVKSFGYPLDGQRGCQVLQKVTNRRETETVLEESYCLHYNIRCGPKCPPFFQRVAESPKNLGVSVLGPDQQRVKS